MVPPCERLNTNFHSIIRLANWGDIGSFCMLILLIIGAIKLSLSNDLLYNVANVVFTTVYSRYSNE